MHELSWHYILLDALLIESCFSLWTNVMCLWKMHIAMHYDPSVGDCVSNRLIRMQIDVVWKMTMRALREVAQFMHGSNERHKPLLVSFSSTVPSRLRGIVNIRKKISWICLFHANAGTEIKQKEGIVREEESKGGVHRLENRTDLYL